jgi:Icc-related predicted phosphoesterase
MKILTISDNVLPQLENSTNLERQYQGAEAVISCGDMPAPYLEYITSVLNLPLFYVRGNHDGQYKYYPPGGQDMHLRIIAYNGLVFAGLEGCIRYNKEDVQYTEGEMAVMVLRLIQKALIYRLLRGRGIDLMVTHSPPRGIHDLEDRAHRGFQSFNRLLRWLQPRYMIHGHVDTHDSRRPTRTQVGQTEVININPVKFLDFQPK